MLSPLQPTGPAKGGPDKAAINPRSAPRHKGSAPWLRPGTNAPGCETILMLLPAALAAPRSVRVISAVRLPCALLLFGILLYIGIGREPGCHRALPNRIGGTL